MSGSFENFDFFSKKDDLRVSLNQKYSAQLNNNKKTNQSPKSFKDIFKDINTLSEHEEIKPKKE